MAQLVPRLETPEASGLAGVAFEPEPVVNAAYLHPLPLGPPGATFLLGGGVKLPPLSISSGDLRVQLIASAGYRPSARWGGLCSALPYLARAENDAATLYGLGLELRCEPSHVRGSWSFGLDLGWQQTLATHVESSALARRTFGDRYPPGVTGIAGPKDGWYRFTSERFRLGVSTSHRFRGGWSGALALGTLFTRQDQGVYLPLIPFYLELSTTYAL